MSVIMDWLCGHEEEAEVCKFVGIRVGLFDWLVMWFFWYFQGQATPSNTEAEIVAEAVKDTTLAVKQSSSADTGAAESLLPIVSSQRERFRLRNQELEAVSSLIGYSISNLGVGGWGLPSTDTRYRCSWVISTYYVQSEGEVQATQPRTRSSKFSNRLLGIKSGMGFVLLYTDIRYRWSRLIFESSKKEKVSPRNQELGALSSQIH